MAATLEPILVTVDQYRRLPAREHVIQGCDLPRRREDSTCDI